MPRYVLAIDQGTTGTTVLVFNRAGRVVGRGYREFPQIYPRPGWVEHDPDVVWQVTRHVMREALRTACITPTQLAAIGITNQRETTVVWDRRSSRPVANAIVWQCRRTAPLCEQLKRQGSLPLIRRKTGLVLDAYFSGTKIRWLLDNVPGVRRRAQQGEIAFGTIDTWLLWQLTGGSVHATDFTNASRTLLFNIRTRRWDPELLRRFHIPRTLLPTVLPSSGAFGTTAKRSGLPRGIPITGIAGDQQAALFGQGCTRAGLAKNTYGTGCFLLLQLGNRWTLSRHGLITTLACDPTGQPSYALEGSVFIAGAAIQWLRDGLQLIRRAADTEAIARSLKDTGGVYVVPALVGLGAPYWDMQARGAVVGITRGTTRAHLIRATLESLAYQTRDVVEAMEEDSGVRLRTLRVDGGAAQNNWLMQFQADLLGRPVVRPRLVETTALGAARLAGLAANFWRGGFDATGERVFHPRMNVRERDRLYAGWQEAVARVRSRRDAHT